jgi:hypothetical protein
MECLSLRLDMRDLVSELLENRAFQRAFSSDLESDDDTKPEHPSPNNTVGEAPGANMKMLDESCELEDAAASTETSPDLELSSRIALEKQLTIRMSEDNQRDVVSALAQNNPSLRYVNISPWVFTDTGTRRRSWEIVRDGRHKSSCFPVVREVSREDADQLWTLFQAADA